MSMLQSGAQSAVAFQLVAALEDYEGEVERLARTSGDLDLYLHVSQRMDRMRLYAASLPQISVHWVEVLIGHFEFTHCLWRVQSGQAEPAELRATQVAQREAAARLRDACKKKYLATG